MPAGSFFGELEFLGFSEERTVSVRAKRYCEVASLHPNGERRTILKQLSLTVINVESLKLLVTFSSG